MLYSLLLLIYIISICGSERVDPGCSRTINVDQMEFGVVYEYIRDEMTCSFEFRAKEGQRIMLAISHIGLLPKNSNEDCVPKISISDLLFTGEKRNRISICNAEDAKTKGSFVSAAKAARIDYNGPSDVDGILLIQFWFVKDVTLIPKAPVKPPSEVTEPGKPTVTLECPDWGADIELESCSCVELGTGKLTNLEPPFCLIPARTLTTKCLQEESEIRHNLATNLLWTNERMPPSCDDEGNYEKLQCDGDSREPCTCVDPISGDETYLMPPNCEFPITTTEMTLTTLKATTSPPVAVCKLYPCQAFCPYGQNNDDLGCPTCSCKDVMTSSSSETCQQATIRTENYITQWKELKVKTTPYPWLPDCSADGNYKLKQCNHIAGCFCVDRESGRPSGKKTPECETYKNCVTKRITSLYRALRDAGHRKTAKLVRNLLTGDDANDVQLVMDMLSEEEKTSIFANPSTHIPSCNDYGDYEALQCRTAEGTCWCVDVNGEKFLDSESSTVVVPECSIYYRQVAPIPIFQAPLSDTTTVKLDNLAILYCDFFNLTESGGQFIYWTQNGVPVSSFNDHRYVTGNLVYLNPTSTSWFKIEKVAYEDAGAYRCEIADSSNDLFLKSDPQTLTVWSQENNEPRPTCIIQPCEKYCSMGYKKNQDRCRICECLNIEEATLFSRLFSIQREMYLSFGAHDGRCVAKRQLIHKQLMEMDLDDPNVIVQAESIPNCDSDGNYEVIQNLPYFGTICVDKMNGQASGRIIPDCDEWTPCLESTARVTKDHITFFTNESTAQEVYLAARRAQSTGEQISILENAMISYIPLEYVGELPNLPAHRPCDINTGVFYTPQPVCADGINECWCVDENGNELDGTRSVVNETMTPCQDYLPALNGPNLLNMEDADLNTTVGSTITLRCDVSAYSPDTYVMWTTPSGLTLEQMMVIDNRYEQVGDQVTDYAMRITNIQEKDKGFYTCSLYNYRSTNDVKQYLVKLQNEFL